MDIQDISYIDANELGVRPSNWTEDEHDIDFNDITAGYFGKEKLNELQTLTNGKKSSNDEEDVSMCDEDDLNYETDPETGKSSIEFFF